AEPGVAERVVEVAVRVDHPADRPRAQLPQVGPDLVGLAVRGAGVADEQAAGAAQHADAHVEGLVPAPENVGRHLLPGCHRLEASARTVGAATRTTGRCRPPRARRPAAPWRPGSSPPEPPCT